MHSISVAIVGGGPVGALCALRLAQSGFLVTLLEAKNSYDDISDGRTLALSWASLNAMKNAGVDIEDLTQCPIDQVHVSIAKTCGRTLLSREDLDLPHLGYVVKYGDLVQSFKVALLKSAVNLEWGASVEKVRSLAQYSSVQYTQNAQSKLATFRSVILADGGSLLDSLGYDRYQYDYEQNALIAKITTDQPTKFIAYERFSEQGPYALLPTDQGYTVVWTLSSADALLWAENDGAILKHALSEDLGSRIGKITDLKIQASFKLKLQQVKKRVEGRIVLLGNAAQTLHPVAAQGFNLGVRDVEFLIMHLLEVKKEEQLEKALHAYAKSRQLDVNAVLSFTHGLVKWFDKSPTSLKHMQALGMNILDTVPSLRKLFAGQLVFGIGSKR